MKKLFVNARIITPYRILPLGWSVITEAGKIAAVTEEAINVDAFDGEVLDVGGNYLAPGFIDMHTHGAGNCDFMDGNLDAVRTACKTHMSYGTTSLLPTTLSSRDDELTENLAYIEAAAKMTDHMPNILGCHLEGPYFAPSQNGAQNANYLKTPNPEEYARILDQFPSIRKWTIAPELEGAMEMGRTLRQRGVIASIGHSDATGIVVENAIENGYTMVTHLYNGMSRLTRKNAKMYLGVAESTLLHNELTAEIIADGRHLPIPLLKLIYQCKGAEHLCLVTDSMRAAGVDCTESILGSLQYGQKVEVDDGVAYMPGRNSFGGSVATADRLVRTMYHDVRVPLERAVEMITLTPARMLGIQKDKGAIEVGKDADIVMFDENINIMAVMVRGDLWINRMGECQP